MNKEEYLVSLEKVKQKRKMLEDSFDQIKLQYIEDNKPCDLDDNVIITLNSGRKVTGQVKSFGILRDYTVSITSYKEGTKTKYITVPHLEVVKL